METNLLTIKKAAPLISVSTVTLRRLIAKKQIGYKRYGKIYYFTPEHLQSFLDRIDVKPQAVNAQGVN